MNEYLSLGVGVQSSTLAFMADRGEVTPMPKAAFFGDTQAEPRKVYKWFQYLKENIKNFPVMDATKGNLSVNSLRVRRSKKSGKLYLANDIPLFVKNEDGSKGILGRKCTRDYKIVVVAREIKKHLGIKRIRYNKDGSALLGVQAICWVGISFDEADRQAPSKIPWIQSRWPLLELGMTRKDCVEWMLENKLPEPPRSACIQCPYHSDATWLDMKENEPEDFADAVQWERDVQAAARQQEVLKGIPYCHDSLVLLDQVVFDPTQVREKFNRACEGMCGV